MHNYTVLGLVVKRTNFGEADKIITLFTHSRGKVAAMARGVRKISSKRGGSLELFNLIKASVHPGRGDFDTLGEVQVLDTFPAWRMHLGRVSMAFQLAEAIDKLTPDREAHPKIFELLCSNLSQISFLGSNWKITCDNWLVEIVQELGYWPKTKSFTGNIYEFIENITSRPLHSPAILKRLSRPM
jgi:DNA repair protein RecO (recombination protein O)